MYCKYTFRWPYIHLSCRFAPPSAVITGDSLLPDNWVDYTLLPSIHPILGGSMSVVPQRQHLSTLFPPACSYATGGDGTNTSPPPASPAAAAAAAAVRPSCATKCYPPKRRFKLVVSAPVPPTSELCSNCCYTYNPPFCVIGGGVGRETRGQRTQGDPTERKRSSGDKGGEWRGGCEGNYPDTCNCRQHPVSCPSCSSPAVGNTGYQDITALSRLCRRTTRQYR